MLTVDELLDRALTFLDRGGPMIWLILLVSGTLWILILERHWYLHFDFPKIRATIFRRWQPYRHQKNSFAKRIREVLLEELWQSAGPHLRLITALTRTLPLLGLLGTVIGMIQTFDVITIFGSGNARGLAGGISQALLTTMSGLVAALFGLYFGSDVKHRLRLAVDQVESDLD